MSCSMLALIITLYNKNNLNNNNNSWHLFANCDCSLFVLFCVCLFVFALFCDPVLVS